MDLCDIHKTSGLVTVLARMATFVIAAWVSCLYLTEEQILSIHLMKWDTWDNTELIKLSCITSTKCICSKTVQSSSLLQWEHFVFHTVYYTNIIDEIVKNADNISAFQICWHTQKWRGNLIYQQTYFMKAIMALYTNQTQNSRAVSAGASPLSREENATWNSNSVSL